MLFLLGLSARTWQGAPEPMSIPVGEKPLYRLASHDGWGLLGLKVKAIFGPSRFVLVHVHPQMMCGIGSHRHGMRCVFPGQTWIANAEII